MPYLTSDDIAGACIIGGLGVVGLLTNGIAMLVLVNGGRISQSFQQLCFSHCTATVIVLTFFLFYCSPMVIWQSSFSQVAVFAKLIGGFMVALWDVSVYSHLISSINRLIVLHFPIESRHFFRQRNTTLIISLIWFLGLLHFLPYLKDEFLQSLQKKSLTEIRQTVIKVDDCYIVFMSHNYLWSFASTQCGFILGKVLDFGTGVTIFALNIIFDILTIIRIRRVLVTTRKKTRRSELKFFVQSCLQFATFVVKLTCFYFISGFFTGDIEKYHWQVFFTTSFIWEFTHCIDGSVEKILILIPFHLRDYLRARRSSRVTLLVPSFTLTKSRY